MKPDFILSADWHLTDRQPPCRTDDYLEAQERKLGQISELQIEYDCPVLVAGDIFDKWKPPPSLLRWAIENMPENVICIPGNHDLPAHSIDRYDESGLGVLEAAAAVSVVHDPVFLDSGESELVFHLDGYPYGFEVFPKEITSADELNVCMFHEFVYKGRVPFPGATGKLSSILKKVKGYDLVLCGDNHKPFTHVTEDQIFVNPGSLMRMTADQTKHRPRVYLYYTSEHRVEPVYLDVEAGAVSREHIEAKKERSNRIDAFVSKLGGDFKAGLDFHGNMKEYLIANKIPKLVGRKIMGAING